ncbi:DUF1450 domain-containing protein [Niallia sp. Krafla_26]|uniref:DUF1450 domain-containing protein n=1 Tax=Niallia sp. Krafla_26 TaxID=3064703 RepID=UPI003D164139
MGTLIQKFFGKKKVLKLEFCQNNLDRFLDQESQPLFSQFVNQSTVSVKEFECLSHCKRCNEKSYAFANGEFISANHYMDLLERLKKLHS